MSQREILVLFSNGLLQTSHAESGCVKLEEPRINIRDFKLTFG